MQIIIPMSGFGERFRRAGYNLPKPLIEVEGKPIIAHVIDMFPGETDFIFICNRNHLENPNYKMRETLETLSPSSKIFSIEPHKLGPVYAVLKAEKIVNIDSPTIVNYCDFTCYWDWKHYKDFLLKSKSKGSIPAYKGFHPHSLGKTNYAYIREKDDFVEDIQEKKPYTDNKMNEYASSGTYFFESGKLMLKSFNYIVDNNINLNGEYYVSLAYKYLLKNNNKITIYPLQHFMQWGTPQDLEEYNYWSDLFKKLIIKDYFSSNVSTGTTIIPMAGLGQRFINEGYKKTKPLIEVSGKPMVIQAIEDLPNSKEKCFVLRSDMKDFTFLQNELVDKFPNSKITSVSSLTEGQACSALIGLEHLKKESQINTPITFGACDNGALYLKSKIDLLLKDDDCDIIVWGVRGYYNAINNPQMYGWINEKNGDIKEILVKKPLEPTKTSPIVLGTFTFKHPDFFTKPLDSLISQQKKVNGEYYIDSCINEAIKMGYKCKYFEVDSYLCWGTPNDLKSFEYWQSCFNKWNIHPYSLKLDNKITSNQIPNLEKKFKKIVPEFINCDEA